MPTANRKPEESYMYFDSDLTVTDTAKKLGVCKKTLKKWWVAKYGEEAYEEKVRPTRSPEELLAAKRASRKKWYQNNPDKVKAISKRHREKQRKYNKNYYVENAERLREYARSYRRKNREETNGKIREYWINNPERYLTVSAKSRAKRCSLAFDLTYEYVRQIIPDVCPILLEPFERGEGAPTPRSMTLDKIDPNLGYVRGNVAVISRLANTMKQNCVDPEVFLRLADYVSSIINSEPSPRLRIGSRTPSHMYQAEKAMLKSARQRAKAKGVPFEIDLADVIACFPEDGRCLITGQPLKQSKGNPKACSPSLDRLDPHVGYVKGNIIVISYLANTMKQDCSDAQVFLRLAEYVRKPSHESR